jgi:hypothetical protein
MLSRAQRSANHYHVKSPFDADDQIGAVGRDGLHQRFWGSGPVPVEQPRSLLGYNTAIHGASMQIDAAVKLVRLSVEAPEVSSSPEVAFPSPSLPCGRRRGGLNKYQGAGADALQRPLLRRSRFRRRLTASGAMTPVSRVGRNFFRSSCCCCPRCIARGGARKIRRLTLRLSGGGVPPDWPPSGACLCLGSSALYAPLPPHVGHAWEFGVES